jgi:hypothetical protein
VVFGILSSALQDQRLECPQRLVNTSVLIVWFVDEIKRYCYNLSLCYNRAIKFGHRPTGINLALDT